jgi:predicted acetyltransferase
MNGGGRMIEIVNRKINLNKLIINTSCIYFCCVIEGTMEGRVWVNSLKSPTFAVVWNEYQKGFQFMGKPVEQIELRNLRVFFEDTLFCMLKDKEMDYFECGTDSDELTKMLYDIFSEYNIDSEQQKVFGMNQILCPINNSSKKVEREYEIIAIDGSFLQKEYENIKYVVDEIVATWISLQAYIKDGYGFAAVKYNKIVGKALVTCSYKEFDNVGVDTLKDFRRKGISTNLVYRTLEEGKKRNRKNIWDCMEDNLPSESTALKVGFLLERTYTVCWFKIK